MVKLRINEILRKQNKSKYWLWKKLDGISYQNLNNIIENKTAKMITAQASGHESLHVVDTSELYAEDVQLISKDGKIYYLPESKAE